MHTRLKIGFYILCITSLHLTKLYSDDWLDDRSEDYRNCSVLHCLFRKISGSGSVWPSHQTVSSVSKIGFAFHFWHKSFILYVVGLQSYPTTVLSERMWHFRGRGMLWPLLHIFRGSGPPKPHDLRPWLHAHSHDGQLCYRWSGVS